MISRKSSGENKPVTAVIICGPTGCGKSELAMAVAERFGGHIISADSRQIYCKLDIGTAKPTAAERARVPHYLIDVANVNDEFTARDYSELASKAMTQISDNGHLPVIVGGSGLYLMALTTGIFDGPGRDDAIRTELQERALQIGVKALHAELAHIDPETADKISPGDLVRTVRALEVYRLSGVPISRLQAEGCYNVPDAQYLWIGLDRPRELLYELINRRVDRMIADGLLDEIKSLLALGLGPAIRRKRIVGYFEIIDALESGPGQTAAAIALVKQHSRNYAKRQLTWFRNKAPAEWFDPGMDNFFDKVFRRMDEYLSKRA